MHIINGEIIQKKEIAKDSILENRILLKKTCAQIFFNKIEKREVKKRKSRGNAMFIHCYICHEKYYRDSMYTVKRQSSDRMICKECAKNFKRRSPKTIIISPKI